MASTERDRVTVFYNSGFLPVANGGNARLADLLNRLTREFERVSLYCYSDHSEYPWRKDAEAAFRRMWPMVELVLEPKPRWLGLLTRAKNLVVMLAPARWTSKLLALSLPGGTPRFEALKRQTGAFVISYTEGLTQVNGIDASRCVVETHDLNFLKWTKINGGRPVSAIALRKLRTEMTLLAATPTIVAISEGEATFFRMMLPDVQVLFVPAWAGAPARSQPIEGPPEFDLVFVGSHYTMNVRGLCDFLERDGPVLSRYRIAVCGGVCEDAAVQALSARFGNVRCLGFVDDLGLVYARSRAAISPVDGTGTKMKVLGALQAGLLVFASPQSCAGLPPGWTGAVFPLDPGTISAILDDEDRRLAAAAMARRYAAALEDAGDVTAAIAAIRALAPSNQPDSSSEA